jgi:hypothetical protein
VIAAGDDTVLDQLTYLLAELRDLLGDFPTTTPNTNSTEDL